MPAGIVKWFNRVKGYGFIIPEDAGEKHRDVFVHYKVIKVDGYKSLSTGQRVNFESIEGPKGPFATEVTF